MTFEFYGKTIESEVIFLIYTPIYYTIAPTIFSLEFKNIIINIIFLIIFLYLNKKSKIYLLRKLAIIILIFFYYKSRLYGIIKA